VAREGGYGKSTKAEWLKTDRKSYADALTSSEAMRQELETWLADAIAFHAYRTEQVCLREAYAQAELAARAQNRPTPDLSLYQPRRPEPTITPPQAGKGSGPASGRSYRAVKSPRTARKRATERRPAN
jgi:hypothetical protein